MTREKRPRFTQQIVRYAIVGLSNTIIGYLSFVLLLSLFSRDIVAIVGSNVLGIANSYVWNSRWTFRHKRYDVSTATRFVCLYIVVILVNEKLLIVAKGMDISVYVAQVPLLALTMAVGYLGQKYLVFNCRQ